MIGATENLPSGHAVKPGDIVRAKTGTTIEILNTDAEGRLVLADCLAHAIDQGAERLVDLATLTGAIVTTFGNTYAGLFGSDDDWCAEVEAAGGRAGELVWRLPLHAEYDELIKSRYADIANAVEARKAGSITAAQFLAPLHRRRAVGAPRHRRHRQRQRQAVHAQGRRGLRCAAAGRARPRNAGADLHDAEIRSAGATLVRTVVRERGRRHGVEFHAQAVCRCVRDCWRRGVQLLLALQAAPGIQGEHAQLADRDARIGRVAPTAQPAAHRRVAKGCRRRGTASARRGSLAAKSGCGRQRAVASNAGRRRAAVDRATTARCWASARRRLELVRTRADRRGRAVMLRQRYGGAAGGP